MFQILIILTTLIPHSPAFFLSKIGNLAFFSQNGKKKKVFWIFYIYIHRFLYHVLACSQKCEGLMNFLLSYPVYSQIWLNSTMDRLNGKRR